MLRLSARQVKTGVVRATAVGVDFEQRVADRTAAGAAVPRHDQPCTPKRDKRHLSGAHTNRRTTLRRQQYGTIANVDKSRLVLGIAVHKERGAVGFDGGFRCLDSATRAAALQRGIDSGALFLGEAGGRWRQYIEIPKFALREPKAQQ